MNTTNNTKPDPATDTLETVELEALHAVTGGAWPAWTYKVGNWFAQQDPSHLAAGLLM
jgi:hypothetical protein